MCNWPLYDEFSMIFTLRSKRQFKVKYDGKVLKRNINYVEKKQQAKEISEMT